MCVQLFLLVCLRSQFIGYASANSMACYYLPSCLLVRSCACKCFSLVYVRLNLFVYACAWLAMIVCCVVYLSVRVGANDFIRARAS